jgi:hypothetical protein
MATAVAAPENSLLQSSEESAALASQLRRLARVATRARATGLNRDIS